MRDGAEKKGTGPFLDLQVRVTDYKLGEKKTERRRGLRLLLMGDLFSLPSNRKNNQGLTPMAECQTPETQPRR
jgi:hypothetical protein